MPTCTCRGVQTSVNIGFKIIYCIIHLQVDFVCKYLNDIVLKNNINLFLSMRAVLGNTGQYGLSTARSVQNQQRANVL